MDTNRLRTIAGFLTEKWTREVTVNSKEKGKHSHKPISTLRRQLSTAKSSGNTSLVKELNFAIRAKTGWGKVKEEYMDMALTKEEMVLLEAATDDDDGDDLSSSEKALADAADKDLKKKGIDVAKDLDTVEKAVAKKAAAKKPVAAKKDKPAPAAAAPKDEPKVDVAPKAEDKPAPAAEAPKSAEEKAVAAKKKIHHAMEWIKKNPNANRRDFMNAADAWGMGKAYASSYHRILHRKVHGNPDIKEAFILLHPNIPRFAVALNKMQNRYQWVSLEEYAGLEPLVVETMEEAKIVAKYMLEQNSQNVDITRLPMYGE